MQCWYCSRTETLRVRGVPQARLCHLLSAWWCELAWALSSDLWSSATSVCGET